MPLFQPATRQKLKLRMALYGPSGSGKTYTALRLASAIAARGNGRIAVIDTEHKAASKYLALAPDGIPWQFDTCILDNFAPSNYTGCIIDAGRSNYDVLIVDSLSHAWEGKGGALEQVSSKGGNAYTAWKDVTPQHRAMIEAILASPCHVICTIRSKMDYVLEADSKGKMVPKKVGMGPIQRPGTEYEFDVLCDLDLQHLLTVSKTRCPAIDGMIVSCPGPLFVEPILLWLNEEIMNEQQQPQPTQADFVQYENGPCTVEQQNKIKALAQAVGMPPEALSAVVRKRGVERLAHLTWRQADEISHNLQYLEMDKEVREMISQDEPEQEIRF